MKMIGVSRLKALASNLVNIRGSPLYGYKMKLFFSLSIDTIHNTRVLTPGRASGHKTLFQYSSTNTPEEGECYEEDVQHYWKADYKRMI